MIKLITEAIKLKSILEIDYEGGIRIVEPYCHGTSSKGNHILRAYQIDGFSSTGKMGWKLYDISKVTSIRVKEETFLLLRPEYRKGDKSMISIYHEH